MPSVEPSGVSCSMNPSAVGAFAASMGSPIGGGYALKLLRSGVDTSPVGPTAHRRRGTGPVRTPGSPALQIRRSMAAVMGLALLSAVVVVPQVASARNEHASELA